VKRKIALLLTIVFIFTLALPASGFAAMDKELENAIKIAKTIFSIPDDYSFESNISTSGEKKIYQLSWNSKDKMNSASIYVTIDEDGMVTNYSKYTQDDYKQTNKLPKLSKQDATAKAGQYIESIAPGLLKQLRYEENSQNSIMDSGYYMNYCRVVNGIPFYNDMVTVNINRDTGALLNYSRQWTDLAAFPSVSGVMSLKDAQKAYAENLGLRLIYKYAQNDNVLSAYLAYAPIYDNNSYGIDAFTGEKRRMSSGYYYAFNDSITMAKQKANIEAAAGVQLSPEEVKAVEEASKLISQEDAEKIARSCEFLKLTDSFKLQNYYFNSTWPDRTQYSWSLYFTKPADDKNAYTDFVNVMIDAKTGVITGFNKGTPVNPTSKPVNDVVKAKADTDAFLSKYYPQYVKQTEYDKLTSENYMSGSDQNTNYSFVYYRMVNGIPFPDNGIALNYDNTSGVITSFSINWFNIGFPTSKAIGIDAATNAMFEKVGLEKQYKLDNMAVSNAKILPRPSSDNASVVLVYMLKNNKPLLISATSGALLNADGTEYKEPVKVNYTDIKGNAAEKQIMVLADNGIYLEGSQFKPNDAITQLDFLTLLSKTLNYYGPVITPKSTSQDIDGMYSYLLREGILKAGEKAPAANVTREEAVKYLVRALKFDKVADIKGIFNISFKDKASISPGLTGYVAIAAGLGIVGKSDSFNPKAKITRGESAIMIYNYLQS